MYFPEDDCPFYRATLFSHYSPHNVPQANTWSLMFEFSESPCKPVPAGDPIEATILGALNTKLIESRDQILSTWHERLEYGYPTPFVGRDELLEEVQPKLMNLGIWSRGRYFSEPESSLLTAIPQSKPSFFLPFGHVGLAGGNTRWETKIIL